MARWHRHGWLFGLLIPSLATAQLVVRNSEFGQWTESPTVYRRVGEPLSIRFLSTDPRVTAELRWYSITPQARDYDNTRACRQDGACPQPLEYVRHELASLRGRLELNEADLVGQLQPGTHWLQATPLPQPTAFSSIERPPGLEIVVRRDDAYTGYLTELIGVPFVLWPKRLTDGRHQTDSRLGADCVALVVYGQRRLGRRIPYMAPAALSYYTEIVPRTTDDRQPARVGDVLHFGFQTAVVLEDRPPLGFLSDNDLIIHSYHTVAEAVPFSQLPYNASRFEVRRWSDGPTALLVQQETRESKLRY